MAKQSKNLSVKLSDSNLFLKLYRGSSGVINYLLEKEFGRFETEAEKIARAVQISNLKTNRSFRI